MHVCGFRDGDPDQLDIAQSSQTRGLAWSTLQHTISQLHTLSTMSLVMVKAPIHKWSRLEVFLSKAQLAEQSASVSQTTSCRSPRNQTSHIHMQDDKKRYAYPCCVTRARKMHGCRATSLHPIRYCFRGLISRCRHSSLTWLGRISLVVPYAAHLLGSVAEYRPRRLSLYQEL